MTMRKLRQNAGLSQEQVAQKTGLSLRTIQRVEAGHRVSYASLRALASVFHREVDLLERELYSLNKTKDEFIEKPLWARLLLALPSFGQLSLPKLKQQEVYLLAYAFFSYAASFLIPNVESPYWGLTTVTLLQFSTFTSLLLAYLTALMPRVREK